MLQLMDLRCEYTKNPLAIDVAKPRLSWKLKSDTDKRGIKQSAYRILVASTQENLKNDLGDLWDSNKVVSEETTQIEYNGKKLDSYAKCWWKVKIWDNDNDISNYSEDSSWKMGLLNKLDWKAKWISHAYHKNKNNEDTLPCPYFRKEFTLNSKISNATVYTTALGIFELYINGEKVGEDCFTPGWTDYNKRVQYFAYDVTELLTDGENAIGAILGNGWYAGYVATAGKNFYGKYPMLKIQMRVELENGSIFDIITDNSWKSSYGPILSSDILMGEYYDSRYEFQGWSKAGFNNNWEYVKEIDNVDVKLNAALGASVQKTRSLKPVSIKKVNDSFIFDLGQNMVGNYKLKTSGQAGLKITLRFGEMLNDDGTLYVENLRSAKQTDTYIVKGDGVEVYKPHFTFHGFRYIEISGLDYIPEVDFIEGHVINSAEEETGTFECSNSMTNQLFKNILWGQRGNFLSVPTDCPQRDERMGWTGDGQIFIRTACYNMSLASFFTKWMRDIVDAQEINGAFTDVAPHLNTIVGSGNNAWGDAGVIIPWTIYLCYGDKRIIEENYLPMKNWIEYLKNNSENYIRPNSGFGDWLSVDEITPKTIVNTAYFAYSTKLLSHMAKVIGELEDHISLNKLFNNIKVEFNKKFVSDDGKIEGDTQTGYALALFMDLLDEAKRKAAAGFLALNIKRRDYHLSTGFVGIGYLLPILTEYDYVDIAYKLLNNDTYPSWGYCIKNGATTIWERWNSYTIKDGFGDVGMNSFNHYSLGSVGEWMYRYAAGIDADPKDPGYKNIIIRPNIGGNLNYIKCQYDSIRGNITSNWYIEDGKLIMDVEIPPNTTSSVFIPTCDRTKIRESNNELENVKGIYSINVKDNVVIINIGSGRYNFIVQL